MFEKFCLRMPATKTAMERLLPHQTAFKGHGAVEQVGITFQAAIDRLVLGHPWVIAQIDIRNAFNSISRSAIAEAVLFKCPHIRPWTEQPERGLPFVQSMSPGPVFSRTAKTNGQSQRCSAQESPAFPAPSGIWSCKTTSPSPLSFRVVRTKV